MRALVLVAGLAPGALVRAQSVGIALRYELGVPLGINRTPNVLNRFYDGDGTSINNTVGVGVEVPLPGVRLGRDFSVRLTATYSGGRFTSSRYLTDRAHDRVELAPIRGALASFSVTSREMLAGASAHTRLELGGDWRGIGGVWMTHRLYGAFEQREWLLGPAGSAFANDSAEQVLAAGDSIAAPATRLGIDLGVTRSLVIGGIVVDPELGITFDTRGITEGIGLRAVSGFAGVVVRIGERRDRPSAVDTLAESVSPSTVIETESVESHDRAPVARLRLRSGGDASTAVLRARIVERRLYLPFSPVLFLEGDSLSSFYASDVDDTAGAAARLAMLDAAALGRQQLTVLAMRMRQRADAALRIVAPYNDSAARAASHRRAVAVRDVLVDRFGIDSVRLSIDDERVSGRTDYVRLASTTRALFAPIATAWRERELDAPSIGIEQSIASESGVRRWQLAVRSGGRTILARDEASGNTAAEIAFPLRDDDASDPTDALIGTLIVEDSLGRITTARDTLDVIVDTTSAPSGRMVTQAYLFSSVDDLPEVAAANARVVRRIAEEIVSGSAVSISTSPARADTALAGSIATMLERALTARHMPARLRLEPSNTQLPELLPNTAAGAFLEVRTE